MISSGDATGDLVLLWVPGVYWEFMQEFFWGFLQEFLQGNPLGGIPFGDFSRRVILIPPRVFFWGFHQEFPLQFTLRVLYGNSSNNSL